MDRNQRLLVVEGAASSAYLILTQGALYTALALYFGLDPWWLAVTAAFPLAFQLLQVFVPPLVARSAHRPGLLNLFNGLRGVWLVPVLVAILHRPLAWLFILCFALSQMANACAANVWMCLMRDLVPQESRGGYFGKRNLLIGMVTLSAMPLYMWLLEVVSPPWNVGLIIGLGMCATLVSILAVNRIDDARPTSTVESTMEPRRGPVAFVLTILRDNFQRLAEPNFRRLVLAFFVWNLVVQIASPFFSLHQIRDLEMPLSLLGLIGTLVSVLSMLTFRLWGRVADRYGHKSVLVLGLLIVSLIPLLWVFMAKPIWPYVLIVDIALTALGWSAVHLTLLTLPLETAPRADSAYFALLNALGGLGGLVGAVLGGSLALLLEPIRWQVLGISIGGLQVLFGINGLLRLGAVGLFVRIRTHRYLRPSTMVLNILSVLARRPSLRPAERNYR